MYYYNVNGAALASLIPLEGLGPEVEPAGAPKDVARVAYICTEPGAAALGLIAREYPSARLTVIYIRPGERSLPPDAFGVRVRQGSLLADLEGLML